MKSLNRERQDLIICLEQSQIYNILDGVKSVIYLDYHLEGIHMEVRGEDKMNHGNQRYRFWL